MAKGGPAKRGGELGVCLAAGSSLLVTALALFASSGRVDWLGGWLFLGFVASAQLAVVVQSGTGSLRARLDGRWLALHVVALLCCAAVAGLLAGGVGAAPALSWSGVACAAGAFFIQGAVARELAEGAPRRGAASTFGPAALCLAAAAMLGSLWAMVPAGVAGASLLAASLHRRQPHRAEVADVTTSVLGPPAAAGYSLRSNSAR